MGFAVLLLAVQIKTSFRRVFDKLVAPTPESEGERLFAFKQPIIVVLVTSPRASVDAKRTSTNANAVQGARLTSPTPVLPPTWHLRKIVHSSRILSHVYE